MSVPRYPNACPVCEEPPFQRCRSLTKGKVTDTHQARIRGEWPHYEVETSLVCVCGEPWVCPEWVKKVLGHD